MTASTLTQLPLMAGSVLMAQIGRGAHWALARYMRAPLASTAIMALVTMTALAGSNALYFQTSVHPSPFFAPDSRVPRAISTDAPVPAPATMRDEASSTIDLQPSVAPQTTGGVASVPQVIPEAPVGNAEVFAVQKKLAELNLFQGTVDGYYGPMTARAIRAFEERNGFAPMGALSSGVVSAILGSDAAGRAAAPVQSVAPVQPAPQPQAAVVSAPAPQVELASAAAPVAVVQPPAQIQQDQVVAQLPPLGPGERAVDTVGIAAATTIDSIVAAVDGTRATPASPANPPIPTATLPNQAMPAPVQMAAAQPVVLQAVATDAVDKPVSTLSQPRALRPATDQQLVSDIQRGLASLGFFRGAIDGNPGPETARAIREFENFHRYEITGQVQPDLIELLRDAGAAI